MLSPDMHYPSPNPSRTHLENTKRRASDFENKLLPRSLTDGWVTFVFPSLVQHNDRHLIKYTGMVEMAQEGGIHICAMGQKAERPIGTDGRRGHEQHNFIAVQPKQAKDALAHFVERCDRVTRFVTKGLPSKPRYRILFPSSSFRRPSPAHPTARHCASVAIFFNLSDEQRMDSLKLGASSSAVTIMHFLSASSLSNVSSWRGMSAVIQ